MKVHFIFVCFFLVANIHAQREHFKNQHLYCWAKQGINLRKFPSKNSEKVSTIPFGSIVIVVDSLNGTSLTDTLKKKPIPLLIKGNWIRVHYNKTSGYVFDGYLSGLKPQSLLEYFDDIKPIIDSSSKIVYKEIYRKKDGAYYKYEAEDGCFDHQYFIPDISFEEAVLLLRESYGGNELECPFFLQEIKNNEYFFSGCTLTTYCSILKIKGGYLIHTADCT